MPGRPVILLPSSELDQSDYIARMAQLTHFAQSRGNAIEAVNFVSLQDPPRAACVSAMGGSGFEWFCYLGLVQLSDTWKQACWWLRFLKTLPLG